MDQLYQKKYWDVRIRTRTAISFKETGPGRRFTTLVPDILKKPAPALNKWEPLNLKILNNINPRVRGLFGGQDLIFFSRHTCNLMSTHSRLPLNSSPFQIKLISIHNDASTCKNSCLRQSYYSQFVKTNLSKIIRAHIS